LFFCGHSVDIRKVFLKNKSRDCVAAQIVRIKNVSNTKHCRRQRLQERNAANHNSYVPLLSRRGSGH